MPDTSSPSAPGGSGSARDLDGTFIEVEIGDSIKGDGELAKKLEEVCPVNIFKATPEGVDVVRENLDECVLCELCLDPLPTARSRSRNSTTARSCAAESAAAIASALLALGLASVAGVAVAKPDDDKPPKPPKPTVTVLTTTEIGALENRQIKVQVTAKKAETATVSGTLLIDGFPDDFSFKLAPRKATLKNGTGKVRWGLSARKREVLDFAIKSCRPASVTVTAEARGRSRTVTARSRPTDRLLTARWLQGR